MTQGTTDKTAAPDSLPAWSRGDVLGGRFRIVSRLGRGGFGEVYKAEELLPDGSVVRELALKLLPASHLSSDWAHEAKVLAQIRHPSLVGIVSAGVLSDSGLPFVAMELLEGEPLSVVLRRRGTVGFRRAIEWGRQIASALDAVHELKIVHLDLKPANLHLGPDGRVRVLDFGIAHHGKRVSVRPVATADALATDALLDAEPERPSAAPRTEEKKLVLGTPGFTAPEILEGRTVTPGADAYALGVCLHQMITGRLPQRARELSKEPTDDELRAYRAELRDATLSGDLVPLPDEVPRAVREVVTRLLSLDPKARPTPLAPVLDEVHVRPYGVPAAPYLGLAAYGASREGFLFGRDADIARLSGELEKRPALVLAGASGSGKSSLAVAGVAPELEKRFPDGLDVWRTMVVRPGVDLDDAIASVPRGEGVVLVVDQLEEAVTQLDASVRTRFALALSRICEGDHGTPRPGLRVICTLREDFATRVAALGSLSSTLEHAVRFVAPPSPSAVSDIVTMPAKLRGVSIDDPRPVVDDVLRETRAGEGRLPLVSFALAQWWETRRDDRLSARAWQEGGGVAGALSRHAESTLGALPEDTRAAARRLCLRLVTAERTRARVPENDLVQMGTLEARALSHFERARLVSVDEGREVTLSHESLLFAWQSLAVWLDEEDSDRKESAGLVALARVFAEAHEDAKPDALLRGGRLVRALELEKRRPDLTASFEPFLRTSQRRERRDALLRNALVTGAILAALGIAGVGYWTNQQHAQEIKAREDNLRSLVKDAEGVKKEALAIKVAAAEAEASARVAALDLKRCRDGAQRSEQAHRKELFAKYPQDSLDQRLVAYLLQWEHLTNLHDETRVATFYADEIEWLGGKTTRDDLSRAQAAEWAKNPSYRLLLGEIQPVKHAAGEHVVRVTRDERRAGMQSLAVWQVTLTGDKPDELKIVKVALEKTVAAAKPIGCN